MYKVKPIKYFRNKSKYHNIRKTYNGYTYQSKLEAKTAQELDFRIAAENDDMVSWERQVKISLDVNGEHICNYYIDFVGTRADGIKEYIECKGLATDTWRIKWKLFLALYKDQIEKGEIEVMIIK